MLIADSAAPVSVNGAIPTWILPAVFVACNATSRRFLSMAAAELDKLVVTPLAAASGFLAASKSALVAGVATSPSSVFTAAASPPILACAADFSLAASEAFIPLCCSG